MLSHGLRDDAKGMDLIDPDPKTSKNCKSLGRYLQAYDALHNSFRIAAG